MAERKDLFTPRYRRCIGSKGIPSGILRKLVNLVVPLIPKAGAPAETAVLQLLSYVSDVRKVSLSFAAKNHLLKIVIIFTLHEAEWTSISVKKM